MRPYLKRCDIIWSVLIVFTNCLLRKRPYTYNIAVMKKCLTNSQLSNPSRSASNSTYESLSYIQGCHSSRYYHIRGLIVCYQFVFSVTQTRILRLQVCVYHIFHSLSWGKWPGLSIRLLNLDMNQKDVWLNTLLLTKENVCTRVRRAEIEWNGGFWEDRDRQMQRVHTMQTPLPSKQAYIPVK